jgi:ABC-2 type transport system permease protein
MRIARTLKFLAALVRIRLSRQMAHAPSFWAAFLVDSSTFFIQAAAFLAIYGQVDSINGWGRWESVFFVGTFTLVDGLYMLLYFFGILRLPEIVNTGKLDGYLTKPVSPLLHLSFESVDPGSGLLVLPALALIAGSSVKLGIGFEPVRVAAYLGAVCLMLVLAYDLMLLVRLPCFFTRRVEAFNAAEEAFIEFAFRVPGSAYRGLAAVVFRVVLPYGLIAGFPAEVFFSGGGLSAWATGIGVTAAFSLLAACAWKLGLRHYESSGG